MVKSGCKCLHVAASLTEVGLMLASLHDRVTLLLTSCLLGTVKWIFVDIVQILDDEGFFFLLGTGGRDDLLMVVAWRNTKCVGARDLVHVLGSVFSPCLDADASQVN